MNKLNKIFTVLIVFILFSSFVYSISYSPLQYTLPNETKDMKKLNIASREDTIKITSGTYCYEISTLPSIDGKSCGGGWGIGDINYDSDGLGTENFNCSITFEQIFQEYCLHTRETQGDPYGKIWEIKFGYDDDRGYDILLNRRVLLPTDLKEELEKEKQKRYNIVGAVFATIGIFMGLKKYKNKKLSKIMHILGTILTILGIIVPTIIYLI